ncbi:hypothetical protein PL321_05315 [Caloramator sp. mosi_1]|uniref:hypothetical protein n=1 Tax=Caloramator sp. mosi_1 TaxID=3023090 RepID=UPI00235F9FB2|nr:hypothetical protein [Caloramator sp. mosi_1]WDC84970.1 hypothetical protein PL321_05315 [Caloramator sp. mosi_1]
MGVKIVELDNKFITIKKPIETKFEPLLGYEVTNTLTPFEFEISPSAKYFLSNILMTLDKAGNNDRIEREVAGNTIDLSNDNLEDAQYSLSVMLMDKENKCFASVGQKFVLDTTSPEINGLENKVVEKSSRKYNLNFIVQDNLTGYTLYINDDIVDVNASKNLNGAVKEYTIPVDVKLGTNKFEIKAVDFAGNETIKKVEINIKKIEEFNVFVEPINIVYNKKIAKINGKIETNKSFEDMIILVKHNLIKEDGSVDEIEDGRFNVNNDGTFDIEVSSDSFKEQQYNYIIVKDDEILFEGSFNVSFFPVEVLSPIQLVTNNKQFDLRFIVSDEYDYDKVEVTLNNEVVKVLQRKDINGEVECTVTDLDKGNNIVGINVVKENSSWGVGIVNVYVDQDFPTVVVYDQYGNNLSDTPFYNENIIKVFGLCNEEVKNLKINGDFVEVSEGAFEKEIALKEGLNRIFFEIEDIAGNINKYVYKVYCDTESPSIQVLNFEKDTIVVNDDSVELKFKVQDNTLGYRVYINTNQVYTEENEVATGVEKEYSYEMKLNQGLNVVRLDVVDYAGNTSSKVLNIYCKINYPISIDNYVKFDRTSDSDLKVELYIPDDYDKQIKQVTLKDDIVVDKTNYNLEDNNLCIKSEYLKTLERGNYEVKVQFVNNDILSFVLNVFDLRNENTNIKNVFVNGEELNVNEEGEYIVEAEYGKQYIITAVAEDSNAVVEVTQASSIPGVAKIKVTAEDGTVKIYEVKIVYPIELTANNEVEYISGSDAKISINAKNVTSQDRTATLIVGLYDKNNKLVNCISGKYIIKSNDAVEMQAKLKLDKNTKGYKIKAFVWDQMDTMKSISKGYEFIIK